MKQEPVPDARRHRSVKSEEGENWSPLDVEDSKEALKFEITEGVDEKVNIVMRDAYTSSGDSGVISKGSIPNDDKELIFTKSEQAERKPNDINIESLPNHTESGFLPAEPCITLNHYVKRERIEIPTKLEEIASETVLIEERSIYAEENPVGLTNVVALSDVDSDDRNSMPVVVENPPTPQYDTSIYTELTNSTVLPDPVEPILNNHIPTADLPRNSKDDPGPPAKKRRVLFDGVVLKKTSSFKTTKQPPVISVNAEPMDVTKVFIKPEPVSDVDKVKLEFLRNNLDAKVKQDTMLSDEGVVYRLRALGPGGLDLYPIDLEHDVKMATVTRIWMSDTYGGNHRWGCPKIDKKKFTHGIDNFRYINYESCPDAPRTPGAPGLMMGCWGSEDKTYINQRVFMRVNPGKWLAMGIYDCVPSNPLSREEWNTQSPAFQNYWVTEISSKKWAAPARVRIGLRDTLGREPSADEHKQALRNGSYKALPTNLIKQAFDLGLENLSVWCMKCVGYDADLQRALARMPKNYVSPRNRAFMGELKKGKSAKPTEKSERVSSKKRKTRASKY